MNIKDKAVLATLVGTTIIFAASSIIFAYSFTGAGWCSATTGVNYDTVSGMWINVVEYSYTTWNYSGMNFAIVSDDYSSSDISIIYDAYEAPGETTWYPPTGCLSWADITLNEYYVNPSYGPYTPYYWMYDGQTVCTHELGHFLGLNHSIYYDATMYYNHGTGVTFPRSLDYDDLYAINLLY